VAVTENLYGSQGESISTMERPTEGTVDHLTAELRRARRLMRAVFRDSPEYRQAEGHWYAACQALWERDADDVVRSVLAEA
jgi:hypothetical protein